MDDREQETSQELIRACKKGHISLSIKIDSYLSAGPGQIIIGRVRYINSEIVFMKDSFMILHLKDFQDFLHMLTQATAALVSNKECQTSEFYSEDAKFICRIQGQKATIVKVIESNENIVLQLRIKDFPYFFDCIHKVIPIVVTQEETQLKCFHVFKYAVNEIRKEKFRDSDKLTNSDKQDSFKKVLHLLQPKNQGQNPSSESSQFAEEVLQKVMKEMNLQSPNEKAIMREFMRVNWTQLYLYYHFWFKAYVK